MVAMILKPILSEVISEKQFDFLHRRQIHDAMTLAQENLHSVKQTKQVIAILKLDLSKDYDRVSWTFLWLVLMKMGMELFVMNWIMGCVQLVSFMVLINEAPSRFFKATHGIRHGCPLSPFLFITMEKVLSKLMIHARGRGILKGLIMSGHETISHL
jgi:hypothetical protein